MTTGTVVQATPAKINLVVYRGDTWVQQFRFLEDDTPIDLTGLTVQAQARSTLGETTSLVATVTDALDGTISVSLPAGSLEPDFYSYDIEVDEGGAITTWVRGTLQIERDVTNELP